MNSNPELVIPRSKTAVIYTDKDGREHAAKTVCRSAIIHEGQTGASVTLRLDTGDKAIPRVPHHPDGQPGTYRLAPVPEPVAEPEETATPAAAEPAAAEL